MRPLIPFKKIDVRVILKLFSLFLATFPSFVRSLCLNSFLTQALSVLVSVLMERRKKLILVDENLH